MDPNIGDYSQKWMLQSQFLCWGFGAAGTADWEVSLLMDWTFKSAFLRANWRS